MHHEDLKLIRQIVASGGRKYTAGRIDSSKYNRLVDMGWLTPFKTNIRPQIRAGQRPWRTAMIRPIRRLVEVGLKAKSKIARARDLSRYPRPRSAAFAAGPHRRSR